MTKRQKKRLLSILLGLITLGVAYLQNNTPHTVTKTIIENQPGLYKVTEFIDGDTLAIDMNGSNETVRLIGVDTPETHDPRKSVQCYGQAAADFTKRFIGGNSIRLEADPQNSNRDRYNRLLRYVYTLDNKMLNAELIKQGYAFAYTYFPFSKLDEFRNYEQQARASNYGLWGSCTIETEPNGQTHSNSI